MQRVVRGVVAAGASALALGALAACSPSASDFRSDAEDFLRSDEMFDTYGLDLPEPTCVEPDAIETGGTVTCTATAQDDQPYAFVFEITGSRELTLRSIEFAAG